MGTDKREKLLESDTNIFGIWYRIYNQSAQNYQEPIHTWDDVDDRLLKEAAWK